MTTKTMEGAFLERLDSIESRANSIGETLTSICRQSGIARATPDRWRKNMPNSIRLLDKLESALVELEKAK